MKDPWFENLKENSDSAEQQVASIWAKLGKLNSVNAKPFYLQAVLMVQSNSLRYQLYVQDLSTQKTIEAGDLSFVRKQEIDL